MHRKAMSDGTEKPALQRGKDHVGTHVVPKYVFTP